MDINDCNNTADFRRLAKSRLPAPLFHYIDGGADDEVTLRRNTEAFDQVRLIPDALADLSHMDLRTEVLGQKIDWSNASDQDNETFWRALADPKRAPQAFI